MFDAKRLLDDFLGGRTGQASTHGSDSGTPAGRAPGGLGNLGGIGGGALAGGLAGLLLGSKKGRKFAGSALTMGGMALVGAVAYQGYRNWQEGKNRGPQQPAARIPDMEPPRGTPFNPATESEQQTLCRNILRAMIGAAKADGHIDGEEQTRIFEAMDRMALDADDKSFVMEELRAPLDVEAIARSVRSPEEAAEIYTASLLAIDVDNAAERGYLGLLAARLGLDDRLVEHLHASLETAAQQTPPPR